MFRFWRRVQWEATSKKLPGYVIEQRNFYRRASNKSHYGYLGSQSLALLAAALVPVVAATGAERWVSALLGTIAAFGSGVSLLFRFKDNFASRSITLENIRGEIALFDTTEMTEEELVTTVRQFVLEETRQWKAATLGGHDEVSGLSHAPVGPAT